MSNFCKFDNLKIDCALLAMYKKLSFVQLIDLANFYERERIRRLSMCLCISREFAISYLHNWKREKYVIYTNDLAKNNLHGLFDITIQYSDVSYSIT